jgi:hypothetical protein
MCALAVGTSSASPTLTHEEADYYMLALEAEQNRGTASHLVLLEDEYRRRGLPAAGPKRAPSATRTG